MVRPPPAAVAAPLLLAATAGAQLTFQSLSADDIVRNNLIDPTASIKVRNVASSDRSCFALAQNGQGEDVEEIGIALVSGSAFGAQAQAATVRSGEEDQVASAELDLQALHPDDQAEIFDPCHIQFEFRCANGTEGTDRAVSLTYAFGSEEYLGQSAPHEDIFGIFLNGENIALVSDSDGESPVTVGHIDSTQLVSNPLVGRVKFTSQMEASAEVWGGWNTLKFAIGDVDDASLDSWALLAAGSMTCTEMSANVVSPPPETASSDPSPETVPGTAATDPSPETTVTREPAIPMPMAVGLFIILGLLALLMPIVGLTFYNKRIS
ncbi:hypothetical protein ACHAXT_000281 [Thalassiosira profunda]